MTSATTAPMSAKDMRAIIMTAKPGDRLRIVFNSDTSSAAFMRDLKGNLYMLMAMNGQSIDFGDMGLLTLKAVADSGDWEGCVEYVIAILASFDANYFSSRTINRELLAQVSIEP